MSRGRRFPAWLARRRYFRRIERWVKPQRRSAPPDVASPEPKAEPSNVLPFRGPPGGTRGMPSAARRGAGTG